MLEIIVGAGTIIIPVILLVSFLYRDRKQRKRIAEIDAEIARLRDYHAVKPGEITRYPAGLAQYKRDGRRRNLQVIRDHEKVYSEETGVGETVITGERREQGRE